MRYYPIPSYVCARMVKEDTLEFNGGYWVSKQMKRLNNGNKRWIFGNVDDRYDFWYDYDEINDVVGELYWIDKFNDPLVINGYNLTWAFGKYWGKELSGL